MQQNHQSNIESIADLLESHFPEINPISSRERILACAKEIDSHLSNLYPDTAIERGNQDDMNLESGELQATGQDMEGPLWEIQPNLVDFYEEFRDREMRLLHQSCALSTFLIGKEAMPISAYTANPVIDEIPGANEI